MCLGLIYKTCLGNRRVFNNRKKEENRPLKTNSKTRLQARHVSKMASGDVSYKTKVSCIKTWLVSLCLAKDMTFQHVLFIDMTLCIKKCLKTAFTWSVFSQDTIFTVYTRKNIPIRGITLVAKLSWSRL